MICPWFLLTSLFLSLCTKILTHKLRSLVLIFWHVFLSFLFLSRLWMYLCHCKDLRWSRMIQRQVTCSKYTLITKRCAENLKIILLFSCLMIFYSLLSQAWARLCKCLGQDFLPYMSVVMPPLLQSAQLKPDVTITSADSDNDIDDTDDERCIYFP